MINNLFKKIFSGVMIVFIVASFCFSALPKKANAQAAVFDFANLAQNILSYVEEGISAASQLASEALQYSDNYKEYVLDPLMNALSKVIIQQVTASIVNWINTGFEGSPSFVQDPEFFFMDLADQMTGAFIAQNGPLSQLCSPFSIDIRLALSFKYHPSQKRYRCTLSTIIQNSQNAIENASINGFTAGDFRQGGWPAFISLTTEPQNNAYGAYLTADSELSFNILRAQEQKKTELNQGRGFLSWQKCENVTVENNDPGRFYSATDDTPAKTQVVRKCKTETPGSVIAGALDTQLGSPVRQLELSDELSESVNAIFAALVNQMLQQGLASLSRTDDSGKSYLQKITDDIKKGGETLVAIKTKILSEIDDYITKTEEYKANRDAALKAITDVKDFYDQAESCYKEKISSSTPPLTENQKAQAESRIAEIQSAVSLNVAPIATPLMVFAEDAAYRLETLLSIKEGATNAENLEDIQKPANDYNALVQGKKLVNARDLADSKAAIDKAHTDSDPLKPAAEQRLQECQAFP